MSKTPLTREDLKFSVWLLMILIPMILAFAYLKSEVSANTAFRKEYPSADWFEIKFKTIEDAIQELKEDVQTN